MTIAQAMQELVQAGDANAWATPATPGAVAHAVRQADLADATARIQDGAVQIDLPPTGYEYLAFPLQPGKTWQYDLANAADDELIGNLRMHATAVRQHEVTTPAGSFSAVEVAATAKFPDMASLVAALEDELRGAGLTDVNVDVGATVRFVTDYAPAVLNVVQESGTANMDVHIRFTGNGDRYDVRLKAGVHLLFQLTGAELTPIADLGPGGAAQAIAAGRLPADPTGSLTSEDAKVTLSLTADRTEVNAAAGETAAFTATATGVPDGYHVAYEVRDATGAKTASGQATSFEHAFLDPGVHYVVARVTNGQGHSMAVRSVAVVADYDATVQATCGPVSIAGVQSCAPVAVPLRPGDVQATLSVQAGSADIVGTPGTLTLSRPGESRSVDTLDGRATMTPSLGDSLLDKEDWSLAWEATVGVLETTTFHIVLDYAAPATSPPPTSSIAWLLDVVLANLDTDSLLGHAGIPTLA
jgi:hypothetical protein